MDPPLSCPENLLEHDGSCLFSCLNPGRHFFFVAPKFQIERKPPRLLSRAVWTVWYKQWLDGNCDGVWDSIQQSQQCAHQLSNGHPSGKRWKSGQEEVSLKPCAFKRDQNASLTQKRKTDELRKTETFISVDFISADPRGQETEKDAQTWAWATNRGLEGWSLMNGLSCVWVKPKSSPKTQPKTTFETAKWIVSFLLSFRPL